MGASSSSPSCGEAVYGGRGTYGGGRVSRTSLSKTRPSSAGATRPQASSAEDLLHVRDKKKRRSGLSTLKRKLVGRRKNWRSADHGKHFNSLFMDRPVSLLSTILEHYEVLLAMKDLKVQADLARPPAPTLQQNLENLFQHAHCPDFDLIYQGNTFHVHKSILLARCPYFKDLLLAAGSLATELTVRLATPGVDVAMFTSLLRFLYTGEYPSQEMTPHQIDLLISLGRECGVPNLLEVDLEYLHQSGDHTDCILVFTGDTSKPGPHQRPGAAAAAAAGFDTAVQLSCHKAILCARSPFFRNLVARRLQAAAAEVQDRGPTIPQPLRIVLDETVIAQKYARVLVRALYIDSIDFDLVDDRGVERGDKAKEAVELRGVRGDRVKDAMELYQIGRFLDLDILAQNSEDAIVQRLNHTNIAEVLEWSGQPYGSYWVNRQAHQYLLEDFAHISLSPALEKINKETLRSLLSSDYLQASEVEILQSVIRWGELTVARRGETEGILLPMAGGKRGGRRKDGFCDREVAEVVCDLVGCVRVEHIVGDVDVLRQAVERGILSRPWYAGGGTTVAGIEAWDPRSYRPPHQRPRLFLPYYEECKSMLSERSGGLSGDTSSFNFHRMSEIPDTLYMVREERPPSRPDSDLPDQDNVTLMVRRVRKLYRSISVQRALVSPFASRQQIFLQLQLRVVRESNLPDSFTSVLQRAMEGGAGGHPDTPDNDEDRLYGQDWDGRRRHASLHYIPWEVETQPVTDQPLSDLMPDVAIAGAAASLGSLSLSRSVPSPRPDYSGISPRVSPRANSPDCGLSPDVVEGVSRWSPRGSGSRNVTHSYRHGPSHMFL